MNYGNDNPSTVNVRPCYMCCHPNGKGTGTSAKFELHPAHDVVEGSVFVTMSPQKTVGAYVDGNRVMPTFDWENRITVRLSINEVAQMLEVFRGYHESICDGKGLFHKTVKASTVITLEHRLEPAPGYLFAVSRKAVDGNPRRISILLSMTEAVVLCEALAASMVYMAFGVPSVLARERKPLQKEDGAAALKEVA